VLAIEPLDLIAVAGEQLGLVVQIGQLARLERHHQVPVLLELGVDVEGAQVADETLEVLEAEAL